MRKRVRAEDRGNQAEQGNEGTGQSREQREPGRAGNRGNQAEQHTMLEKDMLLWNSFSSLVNILRVESAKKRRTVEWFYNLRMSQV